MMLKKIAFGALLSFCSHLVYSTSTDDLSQLLNTFDKKNPSERLAHSRTLLSNGADINTLNEEGDTLLHLAAEAGDNELIDYILAQPNVTLDAQNKEGDTPLHLAILGEQTSSMQKLIAQKADLMLGDTKGWTPLHLAARRESLACIELLINAGAPLTLTDKKNRTPLDLTEDDACKKALEQAMAAQAQHTTQPDLPHEPPKQDLSSSTPQTPPHRQPDETAEKISPSNLQTKKDEMAETPPPSDPEKKPESDPKETQTKRLTVSKIAGRITMASGGIITGTLAYKICKKAHQTVIADAEKSNTTLSKKEYLKALYRQLKTDLKNTPERRQHMGIACGLACIVVGALLEMYGA